MMPLVIARNDELEQRLRLYRLKPYLINQGYGSEEQEVGGNTNAINTLMKRSKNYLALIAQTPNLPLITFYEHIDDDLQHQHDSLINKALRMEKQSPGGEHG